MGNGMFTQSLSTSRKKKLISATGKQVTLEWRKLADFSPVIKANIINNRKIKILCQPMRCNGKNTASFLWCSSQRHMSFMMKKHQTNPN